MEELREKNKKDENFQILINPLLSCLVMSADEIILLKHISKVLVNKYPNYASQNEFSLEEEKEDYQKLLLSYNKLYLGYRNNGAGIQFFQYYAVKDGNRNYVYNKTLPFHERGKLFTQIMTREETEQLFNPLKYDSMYIMDVNGIIYYAYNKKDGYVIHKTIIPSDEEIINLEKKKRELNNKEACILRKDYEKYEQTFEQKKIEDIKDIQIFGGALFPEYKVLLVTSKEGKFDIRWFSLHFLEKDKFQFNYVPIGVLVPNQEDLLKYAQSNLVEEIPEANIERVLINKNN